MIPANTEVLFYDQNVMTNVEAHEQDDVNASAVVVVVIIVNLIIHHIVVVVVVIVAVVTIVIVSICLWFCALWIIRVIMTGVSKTSSHITGIVVVVSIVSTLCKC